MKKIGIRLCIVLVVVLLLRGFVFTSCLIPSSGMENSLFQGERILVNKWSYGFRVPFMSVFSYQRWNNRPLQKEEIVLFNNPVSPSQPIIDQREVYINRCIGLPGDTLLVDSLFSVVSPQASSNPDKKRLYVYPSDKEDSLQQLLSLLSIRDNELMGSNDTTRVRSFSRYEYYLLEQAMSGNNWISPLQQEEKDVEPRPLIVPGKGKVLRVYPWNIMLLRNTLVLHEGKQAEIKNDTLYVDGRPTQHCYFTKDYYWMASNNAVNLSDSRLFGFVPKDHIIGKPAIIWYSKEDGTGLFKGFRWNRIFHLVH